MMGLNIEILYNLHVNVVIFKEFFAIKTKRDFQSKNIIRWRRGKNYISMKFKLNTITEFFKNFNSAFDQRLIQMPPSLNTVMSFL